MNALAPGVVDTAGMRENELANMGGEDYLRVMLRDIPTHRLATVEEIADIVIFLCSPAAAYINRTAIIADGAQILGDITPAWDVEVP